ncbi:uncharacterized protein LOC127580796 [Pristis pectinata]|uniref:uncharacterized protein LOC127580796 n=1 Tax=Pristis pectinata TaxID=685728 RepID=UPI00223DDF8E|nr:uncharacterized protein LOC127580796 [Pristis pectinata]
MLACSLRTKQCGILILLLCSLPVSGALWAAKYLRGVVGRAITINCHYEAKYHSHTKYWCHGWSRQCSVLVEINGQHRRRERASITDNLARGIFTVTMENLHSGDTGWYSCGITTPGLDPMFHVHLQVSDEPVSVPVLGFLSPSNISCVGGSVSVSCESVQGSLPIQYTWYEKTPSVDSKVSDTSKLDLHCQFFIHQRHQYYCTASNNHGEKPSEMVNVAVFNNTWNCSYVVQFSQTGPKYSCKTFHDHSENADKSSKDNQRKTSRSNSSGRFIYIIVLSVTGGLLMAIFACLLLCLKWKNSKSKCNTYHRGGNNVSQESAALEGSVFYANLQQLRNNEAAASLANNDDEIMYAAVQIQRKSKVRRSVTNEDNVIYTDVKFQNNSPLDNGKAPSPSILQDPTQTTYATVAS